MTPGQWFTHGSLGFCASYLTVTHCVLKLPVLETQGLILMAKIQQNKQLTLPKSGYKEAMIPGSLLFLILILALKAALRGAVNTPINSSTGRWLIFLEMTRGDLRHAGGQE